MHDASSCWGRSRAMETPVLLVGMSGLTSLENTLAVTAQAGHLQVLRGDNPTPEGRATVNIRACASENMHESVQRSLTWEGPGVERTQMPSAAGCLGTISVLTPNNATHHNNALQRAPSSEWLNFMNNTERKDWVQNTVRLHWNKAPEFAKVY